MNESHGKTTPLYAFEEKTVPPSIEKNINPLYVLYPVYAKPKPCAFSSAIPRRSRSTSLSRYSGSSSVP